MAQLNKSTAEERYAGPRNGCILWPIMEIKDKDREGTGRGYTDCKCCSFVEDKDGVKARYNVSLCDMNIKIG